MEQYNEIIRSIYASAFEEQPWQDALGATAKLLDAPGAFLLTTGAPGPAYGGVIVSSGLPTATVAKYLAEVESVDVWFHELLRRHSSLPIGFQYQTEGLVDPKFLKRTRFYADYLVPCDIGRTIGAIVGDDSSPFAPRAPLSLFRPVRSRPFSKTDERNLRIIATHYTEALVLRQRMKASDRTAAFLAIERLSTAVLVISRARKILMANPAAESLLTSLPDQVVKGGHICVSDPQNAISLEKALAACTNYRFDQGLSLSVRISGNPGEGVVARLTPIPGAQGIKSGATAIMFLALEGRAPIDLTSIMTTVYRLSPVEVELVKTLCEGLSPEDIAKKREVGLATVKTQLRSVFAKTGTRRQSDLMRLVFSIAH